MVGGQWGLGQRLWVTSPVEGEVRAPCQSRALCSSHPVREAPNASALLQVTMADRAAAERACKDPNPNIDGRKANVNLAYLGAKPRSLQTGERARVFLPWLVLIAIFSVGICGGGNGPPSLPCPRSGCQLSCACRAVTGPSSCSLGAGPPGLGTCTSGAGGGGSITQWSSVLEDRRKLVPGAGDQEDGHPEAAATLFPWLASAGSFRLGGTAAWECRGSPLSISFVGGGGWVGTAACCCSLG